MSKKSGVSIVLFLAALFLSASAHAAWNYGAVTIRPDHPRLYLTADNIAEYRTRMNSHPGWTTGAFSGKSYKQKADEGDPVAAAFAYQITQTASYCTATAIPKALNGTESNLKNLSLIFDWCYDKLTEIDKAALIGIIVVKANIGIEALPADSNSGQWVLHSEEWISYPYGPDAGIDSAKWHAWAALAYHTPALPIKAEDYFKKLWENGKLTDPVNLMNYLKDGSWPEGGYWFAGAKFSYLIELFSMLKSTTGLTAASEYIRNIGNFLMYQSDAYNKRLWNLPGDIKGDTDQALTTVWQLKRIMLFAAGYAQSPYYNWFLVNSSGYKVGKDMTITPLEEMLNFNPLLAQKEPGDLSESRFFPGYGLLLTKSGWNTNATYLSFRANDFFDAPNAHNHMDVGGFVIHKKNYAISPDTGIYTYFYSNQHQSNWFNRSIAHNVLMVNDPNERLEYNGYRIAGSGDPNYTVDASVTKDGGQKYPQIRDLNYAELISKSTQTDLSTITARENTPSFDYMSADITKAYNIHVTQGNSIDPDIHKVQKYNRSLLFLRDGYIIVLDRVEADDAAFKKRWLLHLEGEPTVNGSMTAQEVTGHIESYDGDYVSSTHPMNSQKLYVKALLPSARTIKRIGGTGYEFWNEGKNYPLQPTCNGCGYTGGNKTYEEALPGPNNKYSAGQWRLEISPSVNSAQDIFLNVINVPDTADPMPEIVRISNGDGNMPSNNMIGAQIKKAAEHGIVLFASNINGDALTADANYTVTTKQAKHMIFNLKPNSLYRVKADGVDITSSPFRTSGSGLLVFTHSDAVDSSKSYSVSLSGTADIYPAPPMDTELAFTTSPNKAVLSWTLSADDGAGDNDVASYNIYRSSIESGVYFVIGTVLKGISTYTDTTPSGGYNYYKVSAVDTGALESAIDYQNALGINFDSPSVAAFSVKDRTSSSAAYSNERIVNLTMTATDPQGDGTITKYLVNESSAKPSSATMTASGSATAPATYTLTSAEGSVTVYAWVMDADGNVSDLAPGSSATITLDLTAPSAPGTPDLAAADDTGDSPTDNLTKNTTALTISGSGETGAAVQLYDGASAVGSTGTVSGGVFSIDISLAAGAHSITAKQTDPAGNVSVASAALPITVDTTAPAAPAGLDLAAADDTGTASDDNITSKTTGLTIGGTGETGATVQLYDGASAISGATGTVSGGAFSIDISLAEGTHSITAKQTDPAGNVSATASAELSITVDTTAPGVVSVTGSVPELSTWHGGKIVTVQFTGATDAGSGMGGYAVAWDTSDATVPAVAYDKPAGVTSVASPDMGDGSNIYFHIRAVDKAGNAGTTVHHGPFWIDTVLPSLVSITTDTPDGAYMAGDTVNVTLNFSEPVDLSGGSMHVGLNSGATLDIAAPVSLGSAETFQYVIQAGQSATDLSVSSITLDAAAKITDAALSELVKTGNTVPIPSGSNLADSSAIVVDTTAPSQGDFAATIGVSQVNLSWSGFAEEAGGSGMNRYKLVMSASGYPPSSCDGGTPLTLSGDLALAYTHSGLSSGATYYYRLCAEDKAGNISTGLTVLATMPSVDGTGGAVAGIERVDGGSDSNNLVDGKPSVDLDYTFKITVTDTTTGVTARNVRLYLTQKDAPASGDFYSFDMTCGTGWTAGAICTHTTRLGPAYAHKYHFEAVLADGSTLRYPASGEISGPSVQLLNGFNMIGVPRSGAKFAEAFGGAEAYAWNKTASDYVRLLPGRDVSPGEGFFILRGDEPVLPGLDAWMEPSANEVEIRLSQGWNLISNPYSGDVRLADVKVKRVLVTNLVTKTWAGAAADRWLYNAIYYYRGEDWGGKYASESAGGYDEARLVPWLGYWVYLARSHGDYSLVISKP